jgi:hypothetical protein
MVRIGTYGIIERIKGGSKLLSDAGFQNCIYLKAFLLTLADFGLTECCP